MSDHDSNPFITENKVVESVMPSPNAENGVIMEKKLADTASMNTTTSEDSEYETLGEDNDGASSRSCRSRRNSFSENEDNLSDELGIRDERGDGDGQEENSIAKDKKLDDDEDRRNPQYIPKKGTFYEHDDRTMMDENEIQSVEAEPNRRDKSEEVEKEQKTAKKGKVWTEKADRWTHDLYIEDEQKPKSTQELIDTYGYDIRNEEAPPKARRRRRYGRGPNKYTRNWEDEDAYTRAVPVQRKVFHNTREEFPDLGDSAGNRGPKRRDKGPERSSSPIKHSQAQPLPRFQQPTTEERGPRMAREKQKEDKFVERDRDKDKRERVNPLVVKVLPSSSFPERPLERLPLAASNNTHSPVVLGVSSLVVEKNGIEGEQRVGRGRGFRGTGKPRPTMGFASRGRIPPCVFTNHPAPPVQDSLKLAADMLVQDFSQIYVSNNNNTANKNSNNSVTNIVEETIIPRSERHNHNSGHQGGVEPSGGGGRSKRYSSQRQRSLPETTPPPTYSPPHTIPYYTQPPPTGFVPAPVYNEVAPASVTSPPMQMVTFLPPGPPPTATAAPPYPPPPLLNYMPPPTYPPMTLQPPQIPGQFEELSQAAELYQGQGGITYYSTQTQSAVPRPNPPRRVKLAIPIVPPPDKNGAASKQQEVHSAVS